MTLIAVITIWKRHNLARMVIEHWRRLIRACSDDGLSLQLVVVGSEGDESQALVTDQDRETIHYIEHPNQPLGDKVNIGIETALILGADGVIPCGSDEFLDVPLLRSYERFLSEGIDYMGLKDRLVLDLLPREPAIYHFAGYPEGHARHGEPQGGARCMSARLLLEWDGHAYGSVPRGLDATLTKRLATTSHTSRIVRMDELPCGGTYLDVRMCFGFSRPVYDFPGQYRQIDLATATRAMFAEDEIEELRRLRENAMTTVDALILARGDNPGGLQRAMRSLDGHGISKIIVRLDTRRGTTAVEVAKTFPNVDLDLRPVPIWGDPQHSIHFSKTRNEMLAMSTAQWAFWLDSDEEVFLGNRNWTLLEECIRAEAENADTVEETVVAIHDDGRSDVGPQIRLQRVGGPIRFVSPVHNALLGYERTIRGPLTVHSYYRAGEGRTARTLPMLLRLFNEGEEGSEWSRDQEMRHAAYNLCLHSFGSGDYEATLKWGRFCQCEMPDDPSRAEFWVCLALAAARLESIADAMEILAEALRHHPTCPDILWMNGALMVYAAASVGRRDGTGSIRSGAASRLVNAESILALMGIPLALGEGR